MCWNNDEYRRFCPVRNGYRTGKTGAAEGGCACFYVICFDLTCVLTGGSSWPISAYLVIRSFLRTNFWRKVSGIEAARERTSRSSSMRMKCFGA